MKQYFASQLKGLAEAIDNSLTREDFENAFKAVLDFVKKLGERLNQAIVSLESKTTQLSKEIKEKNETVLGETKQEIKKAVDNALKEQSNSLNYMRDWVRGLQNGKDADEEKIISEVLNQIKLPENKILTPEEVRNYLEELKGEDRLNMEAIDGLKELLEELKNRPTKVGGGGFNYLSLIIHQVFDETPTNSGDDLNFTIKSAPNPINSLRLYRNGQRLKVGATNDYTFSGKTITLLTASSAGEILTCDYQT